MVENKKNLNSSYLGNTSGVVTSLICEGYFVRTYTL